MTHRRPHSDPPAVRTAVHSASVTSHTTKRLPDPEGLSPVQATQVQTILGIAPSSLRFCALTSVNDSAALLITRLTTLTLTRTRDAISSVLGYPPSFDFSTSYLVPLKNARTTDALIPKIRVLWNATYRCRQPKLIELRNDDTNNVAPIVVDCVHLTTSSSCP